MAKEVKPDPERMSAEFSRRCARVVNSVYWEPEYDNNFSERIEEYFEFQKVLTSGTIITYNDLEGKTKESFDRAEKSQNTLEDRLSEGYERFLDNGMTAGRLVRSILPSEEGEVKDDSEDAVKP